MKRLKTLRMSTKVLKNSINLLTRSKFNQDLQASIKIRVHYSSLNPKLNTRVRRFKTQADLEMRAIVKIQIHCQCGDFKTVLAQQLRVKLFLNKSGSIIKA